MNLLKTLLHKKLCFMFKVMITFNNSYKVFHKPYYYTKKSSYNNGDLGISHKNGLKDNISL